MRYALSLLVLLLLCNITPPALAKRPTPDEIAAKAKKAKLNRGNSVAATIHGKKLRLTPVESEQELPLSELEEGQVLGVLDAGDTGDTTESSGRSAVVYVAKDGNSLNAYVASGGKIVAETKQVKVEKAPRDARKEKPKISEGSLCISGTFYGWFIPQTCFPVEDWLNSLFGGG